MDPSYMCRFLLRVSYYLWHYLLVLPVEVLLHQRVMVHYSSFLIFENLLWVGPRMQEADEKRQTLSSHAYIFEQSFRGTDECPCSSLLERPRKVVRLARHSFLLSRSHELKQYVPMLASGTRNIAQHIVSRRLSNKPWTCRYVQRNRWSLSAKLLCNLLWIFVQIQNFCC